MHRVKPIFSKIFKEGGFIFSNALIDLMLVAAIMPLIIIFYMYASNYMEDLDAQKIEWRLFTVELQGYLTDVDSIQIINAGTGFRVIKEGMEYDIEVYSSLIRKQKFNQGHEIMLTGISKCKFSIEGQVLKIIAFRSNGTEERSEYVITGS